MLELKNIKKDYPAGDDAVHALKGISSKFRENEFVCILGPSGCGKTTMLNIIGGLDQYTEGDLIINGKSTRDFTDREWDSYRNESIGFVFQNYNLIPHQTVLQNVELALTLSGVSREERRDRATKVLNDVGLGDQLNKRPNELSGGQMQRVAIARALVNNPDIILADEPTGALDTTTSVQVMDVLKDISEDRLVIMVTHNASLADRYASRIIRMLDGQITDDNVPFTDDEYHFAQAKDQKKNEKTAKKRKKKTSMSLGTSFSLSLKNLMTKKGRTILTSFAGSIGIIGIALILALSQGFTAYIDYVQENTLSSYPLTIESSVADLGSLMDTVIKAKDKKPNHKLDAVYPNPITYDLVNSLSDMETRENDLKSFRSWLEKEKSDAAGTSGLHDAVSGIKYTYDMDFLTYTKESDGTILRSDPTELLNNLVEENMNIDMSSMTENRDNIPMAQMGAMPGNRLNMWEEMLPGENGKLTSGLLESQYDLVYGSWPKHYNEIVLVLDKNNELDDLTLYALGLESTENMTKIMKAAMNGEKVKSESKKWTYREICDMDFRVVLNADRYGYDDATGLYKDLSDTDTGMNYLYDNGIDLKVCGIIRPDKDALASMLTGSIGYTDKLTKYVIEHSNATDAVKTQLSDKAKDIFTGLPFKAEDTELTSGEKDAWFREYAGSLPIAEKAKLYTNIMSTPTDEYLQSQMEKYMQGKTREDLEKTMTDAYSQQAGMNQEKAQDYIHSLDDETLNKYFREAMEKQISGQYAKGAEQKLAAMTPEQLAAALDAALPSYTPAQTAAYYDKFLPAEFSDSTLDDNLKNLGYVNLDTPSSINLYASTFEAKDTIADAIKAYNKSVDEMKQITYTDIVGLMMSSINTIINTISYVLIAFVAISLIVSSIMIGVITLISVQERTKEIGILRAIGASKRNVSSLFNAETMIIGFSSGVLGILVTYALCIPINMILHKVTGIMELNAFLPWQAALILIAISVVLTLFSGLIPSRSAAKKDPVVALRTE
jgi:putative ABC transport system permease protein